MSAEFISPSCMSRCCSPAVFPGHPSGVADLTCPSSSCSSAPSAPSSTPLFQPPSTRLLGQKLRTHPCPPPLLPGWQVHLSSVHLLVQLLFTFLHHHQRPRARLPPSTLASSPAESNLCKVVRAVLVKSNSHHIALLLTAPPWRISCSIWSYRPVALRPGPSPSSWTVLLTLSAPTAVWLFLRHPELTPHRAVAGAGSSPGGFLRQHPQASPLMSSGHCPQVV